MNRIKKMEEIIKRFNAKSVLDVGCGREGLPFCRVGALEKYLERGVKYIGIDMSDKADINLDLNKIRKLPLKINSFDVAVLSHILEHLFEPEKLLKEAIRVSKRWLIVGLPNDFTYDVRLRVLFGINPIGYEKYGHKGMMDIKQMPRFLNLDENGLEIVETHYEFTSFGGRFIHPRISQFLADIYPKLFARGVIFC